MGRPDKQVGRAGWADPDKQVGRRVLVAGAGVTGTSVVAALREVGAAITITDARAEALAAFDGTDVTAVAGLDEPPEDTELVVVAPGFPPNAPLVRAARARGIEVIGDVELACRLAQRIEPQRQPTWLTITGTNGKTTTVTMLESILRAAGLDAIACGNVGLPVLDAVRAGHDVLAVELSSQQLYWQNSLRAKASVVLNVSEDHLDWHGGMAEYVAAKQKIYAGDPVAVYNIDDPISAELAEACARRVGFTVGEPKAGEIGVRQGVLLDRAFGAGADVDGDADADAGGRPVELADVADVRPSGTHNVANALAAAGLARSIGVSADAVREGLRAYTPGAHRCVEVAAHNGIRYVNDSKATNPHAAAASLSAYRRVVWIAGGQLKGASVDQLVADAASRLAGVVLLGVDQRAIGDAVARHAPNVPVISIPVGDDEPMTAAVRAASGLAHPGDVVLLAPAAASK
ncbi:MAG: UDP-N-acetylmuramoyl-L-alanine--D-glutamate ligase, partial [Sciscionella sp.]|nr:UDP-N-acetylmuramoyl-L-alanine--D-glutamate ligase [Sciscionella sp.]